MTRRPLVDLSISELHAELAAAKGARQAADYQDGLANWEQAVREANERVAAAETEIERRLDCLRRIDWKDGKYGG